MDSSGDTDRLGPWASLDMPVALTPLQNTWRLWSGWLLQTTITVLTFNWDLSLFPRSYRIKRTVDTGKATGTCRLVVTLPRNGQVKPHSGVVVHLHGGGWTICRPEIEHAIAQRLADELGVIVVAPDYRKAPYYPYPHALLQVRAILELIAGGKLAAILPPSIQLDFSRIALTGASAGGNLAASLALSTIRQPLPANARVTGVGLVYPVLDMTMSYADKLAASNPAVQTLPPWFSMMFLDAYLPPPIDRADPLVSPMVASDEDLQQFPPTTIITADHDYLAAEGDRFAERLRAVGGDVRHRRFPDVGHGFDLVPCPPWSVEKKARHRLATQETHALVVDVLRDAVAPVRTVDGAQDIGQLTDI